MDSYGKGLRTWYIFVYIDVVIKLIIERKQTQIDIRNIIVLNVKNYIDNWGQ